MAGGARGRGGGRQRASATMHRRQHRRGRLVGGNRQTKHVGGKRAPRQKAGGQPERPGGADPGGTRAPRSWSPLPASLCAARSAADALPTATPLRPRPPPLRDARGGRRSARDLPPWLQLRPDQTRAGSCDWPSEISKFRRTLRTEDGKYQGKSCQLRVASSSAGMRCRRGTCRTGNP